MGKYQELRHSPLNVTSIASPRLMSTLIRQWTKEKKILKRNSSDVSDNDYSITNEAPFLKRKIRFLSKEGTQTYY